MTWNQYVELCKPKIGLMIALTAVVSHMAVAEQYRASAILALAFAMMCGSAGSAVVNHFWDRDIDRRMARTAKRPLAALHEAQHPERILWLALLLTAIGIGVLIWLFNPVAALHLALGTFLYGVVYTIWLKRRTWLNIVIGGSAGSFAVLAGATSVHPELYTLPILMALVLFLWTPSHFWSLAIYLKEEYRQVGVPMLPVVVGEPLTARVILGNTVLMVAISLLPWLMQELGTIYAVGALLFGIDFVRLNHALVKDPHNRPLAWKNFMASMRYLGGLFLAILLDKNWSSLGF
ncbi:MAG: protoheme IX farnesyltransferase [Magnetococcales bacterium]|nr:protoheme IX farnesyltransferase [Magnetococcales bacterium]NGZ06910.1 protoheme IX farnesyltransferase [Magnetococcales bacterium]